MILSLHYTRIMVFGVFASAFNTIQLRGKQVGADPYHLFP